MTRVREVPVHDSTRVRDVRVAAEATARQAGLDEDRTAAAALVATELATNLLKHAGGGRILIDSVDAYLGPPTASPDPVVQIVAIDHGPGIVGAHRPARMPHHRVPWTDDSLLVLHSDGLPSRWTPPPAVPLGALDPAVTAAAIVRDASSSARPVRDDTAVAVLSSTPPDPRP